MRWLLCALGMRQARQRVLRLQEGELQLAMQASGCCGCRQEHCGWSARGADWCMCGCWHCGGGWVLQVLQVCYHCV